jgi:hypothetical protein
MQVRLDNFLERSTPWFTAEGKDVAVRIPFRMTIDPKAVNDPRNAGDAWMVHERTVQANEPELIDAARAAGLSSVIDRLHEGRATPEQVRAVTQALIDAGHLPASSPGAPDLPARIKKMMFDHGIGLDCTGFVQQDFLASRGLARKATGFNPEIANENLANLQGKGFARVSLTNARPGDLFILNPPEPGQVGHTMIVYDHRDATPEEATELQARGFEPGRIQAFVLDSSYGSNAQFDMGGVMRQVWFRDDKGKWARKMETTEPDGRRADEGFKVYPRNPKTDEESPYEHPIDGMYRPLGENR